MRFAGSPAEATLGLSAQTRGVSRCSRGLLVSLVSLRLARRRGGCWRPLGLVALEFGGGWGAEVGLTVLFSRVLGEVVELVFGVLGSLGAQV